MSPSPTDIILDRSRHPVAANDDYLTEGDPAIGGAWGLLIMFAVAFWLGLALAIGRVL